MKNKHPHRLCPIPLALALALATAGVLSIPGSLAAEASPGDSPGMDLIDQELLESHLRVLASDTFRGRGTGEEGGRMAEEYIAAKFREAGLTPLPGEDDYFLEFDLYSPQFDESETYLRWNGSEAGVTPGQAVPGIGMRPFPFSESGSHEAPIVFAGYGISAPDLNYDDYEGLDVEGKIVFILRHEPREEDAESPFDGKASTDHATFVTKARTAQEHGAIGMILVTDPLHHQDEADDLRLYTTFQLESEGPGGRGGGGPGRGAPRAQGEGGARGAGRGNDAGDTTDSEEEVLPFLAVHVSREVGDQLIAASGRTLAGIQTEIDENLWPVRVPLGDLRAELSVGRSDELKHFVGRNVAGYLEGRDPLLKEDWVLVGGHHDHLGAYDGPGDTVYNGADDNGSGTTGVITLAQAFASRDERPRRSMVFTTFAAEEKGLLGSEAMVEQGQIPLEKVAFLLNIDMIGRNADQPLAFTGDGFSRGLPELVEDALEDAPQDVEWGEMNYSGRTDHAAFYARGVPFLTFFSGFHDQYHQLDDHIERIEFDKLERSVRLAYAIADRVAERDHRLAFIHDVSWLGLHLELTEDDESPRAYVSHVTPDSRADENGFAVGDFVDSINEVEVVGSPGERSLGDLLAEIEPGSIAKFEVSRSGLSSQTIEVERAKTGYMGVWPGQLGAEQREELGLKTNEGILLRNVVEGGPCDKAGLESGDVVLEIDGRVVSSRNLRGTLSQIGAGETVDVIVLRDGKPQTFSVTLGERPTRG